MRKVTIKSSMGVGGLLRLRLNGEPVASKKKVTVDVSTGRKQRLSWRVTGQPGTKYSIAITKPAEVKFEKKRSIPNSGRHGQVLRSQCVLSLGGSF